jgi:hypothetical protein
VNSQAPVRRRITPERRGTALGMSLSPAARAKTPVSDGPPVQVGFANPQHAVHALLFMIEFSSSTNPAWQQSRRCLGLFFARHGGLHLLLMLLNAYYNKPAAGRRPGWVFSGLRHRLQISERGLRMLINDAMAEGLIEQQPISGEIDRRCRSYRLTLPVVQAWEALMATLNSSVGDVLGHFDAGALANADYRKWDPARPAGEQSETLPPSHRLRREH